VSSCESFVLELSCALYQYDSVDIIFIELYLIADSIFANNFSKGCMDVAFQLASRPRPTSDDQTYTKCCMLHAVRMKHARVGK